MTLFSFEVPLAHLRDFAPYQDYTFALSFLLENPVYAQYVMDHTVYGHVVYIDNGFNELTIAASPNNMAQLYYKYAPDCIAAPDADWWTTQEVAQAFDELSVQVPISRILGIFRTDEQLYYLKMRGCTHLAIPFEWRDRVTYDASVTHFLGLGNLHDVISGQPPTLDTSKPIKMAIDGVRFEDWATHGTYAAPYLSTDNSPADRYARFHKYLNTKLTPKQLDLAVSNICALKAIVNAKAAVS